MNKIVITFIIILITGIAFALPEESAGKFVISGYVSDNDNGEKLIGATIYIKELKTGTISNVYGFYSLNLLPGTYTIQYSYLGFNTISKNITLTNNQIINIELDAKGRKLDEIVVTGESKNENIIKNEMSAVKMQIKTIKRIPALMGEVDVIKAIQLLPGVQSTSEGSSGFSVRGGSSDQNLILLDESTVYNASHLMGFFSVFNNDAIKDVKLYKGDIPASSGGRLSSLLDVRMKDGNSKRFSSTGGIGTISSRLTLEGPIVKEQTSFIASGRRTYLDLFLPFAKNENLKKSKLFFYDLNLKINHNINQNNRIFVSGYFGRDVFSNEYFRMGFGNKTFTTRWNHLFTKKLFSNLSFLYTNYDYHLGTATGNADSFLWKSKMYDYSLKYDYTYFINIKNTLRFGAISTYHIFDPGSAKGLGEETIMSEFVVPKAYGLQHGIYVSNEQKIGSRLTLKYGLRFSVFQNIAGTFYNYNNNYNAIDSTVYEKFEVFNTYCGLEPRLGFNFLISESTSVKGSYSRTKQYIHLAQNSTAGTPLDIWFPSSPNVKPQKADQIAIGVFKNLLDNAVEISIETYYKKMDDVIDFKDHASLLLNQKLEGELRFGKANSYGVELLVRKNKGKLNGWIGYTFSHTERTIDKINDGNPYLAPYDKPHDVSVVLNYELSKRIMISANWLYSTGAPITFPTGGFEILGNYAPVYSDRNSYRMPDYHRLDISLTIENKKRENKKWQGEWNFSVYNAYAHKNAWVINFVEDEDNPGERYAEMTYLFSIIPSITYNFKF